MAMSLWSDRNAQRYAIGLILSMALMIAAAPAPYLQDFGEWLYQGKILALKLTDPAAVAGFVVAPYPIPNSLAPALLALLCLVVEPITAGKMFLILLLGGWLWSLERFTRRFAPQDSRGATLALLVTVAALAGFFWYGFISYQLGLLLFFTFLALVNERRSPFWIASFGVALFLAHAMTFLAWGLFMALLVLFETPPIRRRLLLALAPSSLLALGFILGRWLTGFTAPVADAGIAGITELLLYKFGSPLLLGGFHNLLQANGVSLLEHQSWLYWLGAVTNGLVALLLAIFVLRVLLKPIRIGSGQSTLTAPLIRSAQGFSLAVIGFYLVAPYNFFGLIHPGGRLLLPLLATTLALADPGAFRWVRWASFPALLGAALSVGLYGLLMLTTIDPLPGAELVPAAEPPRHSVFAFNDWMYRNTRYKYLNCRTFDSAIRFEQIRTNSYQGLGARTGQLTDYRLRP